MLGAALLVFALLGQQGQPSSQNPPSPPKGQADNVGNTKPVDKSETADTSSAKSKRSRVKVDLSGFDLLDSGKLRTQAMVTGQTRGMPQLVALAPKLGKLYGLNPVFAWRCEGNWDKFAFVLRDDQQQEVYRAIVNGKQFQYPQAAPALIPGKTYFWKVEPDPALLAEPSAPVGFLVLAPEQRHEVENKLRTISAGDPYQAGLERGRVFTDFRVWYDAISAYTDLIVTFPNRAEAYEERGRIYAQLATTQFLAEKDFASADAIEVAGPVKSVVQPE